MPKTARFGAAAILLTALPAAAGDLKLPSTSIWTAYDVGASGYAEATAAADAVMKRFEMRVRILPSGTSIGRILPLKTGKADYGFLATETYFATEGTFDFAARQWGPQDLRVLLARLAGSGLGCAGDVGIETPRDLKGKRIGYVKGNPSVNVKADAILAFAGLTRDDVDVVWFGSYAPLKTAVIANQIDCFSSVTTSANMREIEASPRGIAWPVTDAGDKEGWRKLQETVSVFSPYRETDGAGIKEPKWLVGFRYPMVGTYAQRDDDEAYAMTRALDLAFPDYKNATASAYNWAIDIAGKPPADAPFHDGAIRYLKEKGVWTPESQAWQEKRLARLQKATEAWKEAERRFAARKPSDKSDEEAWLEVWDKVRTENDLGPAT